MRRLKPQHASGNYLIKLPNKSYLGGVTPTRTGPLDRPASFYVSPGFAGFHRPPRVSRTLVGGGQITNTLSMRRPDAGCLTVAKGLDRPRRCAEVLGSYLFKKGPVTAITATGYFAKGLFVMSIACLFLLAGFSEWCRLYCTARVIPKESRLAVTRAKLIF